jgi:thioredoxin-like negative regulator of GroEL
VLSQKAASVGAIVLKIDVDQNQNIAASNGISSIPVVHLYKDGVKIDSMVGFNREKLDQMISLASMK